MENRKEISIEYTPEFKDYIPTLKICRTNISSLIDKLFAVFCLGYGTYLLLWNEIWFIFYYIFALICWFNLIGYLFLWIRIKIDPRYKEHYQLVISDSGMVMTIQGLESHIDWDFYKMFAEGNSSFILTHNKYNYSVIPKRAFKSKEELHYFKSLLTEKLEKLLN